MTPPRKKARAGARAAFTLIELAMAAFLLSVGVLTVFAILRLGIQSRREAEEATRLALFADSFFATLRIGAERAAAETTSSDDAWSRYWRDLIDGTNMPLPALVLDADYIPSHGGFDATATNAPTFFLDGESHTLFVRHLAESPDELSSALEADTFISYSCAPNFLESGEDGDETVPDFVTVSLNAAVGDSSARTSFFTLFKRQTPLP